MLNKDLLMYGKVKKNGPSKFGVIGPGNLGEALLRKLNTFGETYFYHPRRDRNDELVRLGLGKSVTITQIIECDLIFITVKPNMAHTVCSMIKKEITVQVPIFISVMAGIPMSFLRKELGNASIIRMMFDMSIGEIGISRQLFAYSPPELKNRLIEMTRPMGRIAWLESEDKIDAATALFGCGPAFVSKFYQAYQEIAKDMGFDKDFVLDLFDSTIFMLSRHSPETIISKIACKDGATEKGLEHLKTLDSDLKLTIKVSYDKCREISNNFS